MAATIQHIAISCKDTNAVAEFYKGTFGMREVRRDERTNQPGRNAIYLTDGHINLALLPDTDNRPEGIGHFGFKVDDKKVTAQIGASMGGKPGVSKPRDGLYAEAFITDPSGTKVDLSDQGWDIGEAKPC